MKKEERLYNVILPVWLLWIFPSIWPFILGGNLLIDGLVLFGILTALKLADRGRLMKTLLWRVYLLGFAADAVGAVFLLYVVSQFPEAMYPYTTRGINPSGFFITLFAVVLSGVCIYFFDHAALKKAEALTAVQRRKTALAMAIITAPWTSFIYIGG